MKTINFYRSFCLAVLIIAFTSAQALSQSDESSKSNSGSFYSLFGLGLPTDNNTARELSLGIPGVSLDNGQSNSLNNPALWGKNTLTTTSSGFNFSKFISSDRTSESENSILQANYLQLTFPILREQFGISASLYPVTRSNYRFVESDAITTPENETVNYLTDVKGSGGINKLELGFGWSVNENISIGYAPSLAFISQKNTQEIFFDRVDFGNNIVDNELSGSSFSQRFGVLLNFRNLLKSNDRVSFGSSINLPVNISVTEKAVTTKQVNGTDREVTIAEQSGMNAKLPTELNAGLTYYPSALVNFSVEGKFQQWSNSNSTLNNTSAQEFELSDRAKLGLGAEYHPYRTNSTSFFSNFRYSAGISFDSGHLSYQGEDVNTLWFSAGLGIISPFSSSTIDISAQYGLRGTTANNLIKEKIWALNLSVNLTELMFFRPKLN